jgi:hypothetical protein
LYISGGKHATEDTLGKLLNFSGKNEVFCNKDIPLKLQLKYFRYFYGMMRKKMEKSGRKKKTPLGLRKLRRTAIVSPPANPCGEDQHGHIS